MYGLVLECYTDPDHNQQEFVGPLPCVKDSNQQVTITEPPQCANQESFLNWSYIYSLQTHRLRHKHHKAAYGRNMGYYARCTRTELLLMEFHQKHLYLERVSKSFASDRIHPVVTAQIAHKFISMWPCNIVKLTSKMNISILPSASMPDKSFLPNRNIFKPSNKLWITGLHLIRWVQSKICG